MTKKLQGKIVLILLVLGLAVWASYPLNQRLKLGLDLKGGMYLTLRVDMEKLSLKEREGAVERALEILRNRIDQFGVSEPLIQRQGPNRIIVQLPGVTDRKRALDLIGSTALLEFKLVLDDEEKLNQAKTGNVAKGYIFTKDAQDKSILLQENVAMTGDSIEDAFMGQDRYGLPDVKLKLTGKGAKVFAKVTGENVKRRLAIVLDGRVVSAPVINEKIPSGEAEISGSFTVDQAKDLAIKLKAGALPAPIVIEEERTVGALLGQDSIRSGVRSTLIGGAALIIFMAIYYMIGGILANIALILNIVLIIGALALFGATLTLPGIAGICLTIGMAVDANVLINERIREELKAQKPIRTAIANGYNKAFLAIVDSNVTTIIAAALLFRFGSGPIRGFGLTLIIGLVSSMFTALVVTRVIFDLLTFNKKISNLKMLNLIPSGKIDFIGKRKICYALSLVLIITGLFVFAKKGENNFGVDFAGGALQEFKFERPVKVSEIRTALKETGFADSVIQQDKQQRDIIIIRTAEVAVDTITDAISAAMPDNRFEIMRVETVGPTVGKLLRRNATLALVYALLGICIYIWFRFRNVAYGVAGILALFHDVLVALAFCVITNRQIDLLIITAFLTIAGYSINDTIVIYDRIREDLKIMRKTSFPDIINLSINQTLSRTVLTTLTTLIIVFALFFLGGEVLHNFAFILIVGFISGIYSTIFIASPLLLAWHKK
ncbi:MAG: protein translocase subunit SecD [Candidatus Omnitrophota bacterium]